MSFGKNSNSSIEIKKSKKAVVNDYLRLHKTFSRQLCKGRVEPHFNKLYKAFRKSQYYIPVVGDLTLDHETMNSALPKIERKKQWIIEQIVELKKKKNFTRERMIVRLINKQLTKLLRYKRNHNLAVKETSREKWRKLSQQEMKSLRVNYRKLTDNISYLLSFDFPVDHLKARIGYDGLKGSKLISERKRANLIYMTRRMKEDGAQDKNGKKSDMYLRSTIDTIHIELQKNLRFLSENIRYDLEYVLRSVLHQTGKGKWHLVRRLRQWRNRTKKTLSFYNHLFDKVIVDGKEETVAGAILKKKAKATFTLKKYSLEKQRDTYLFWSEQSELMQALFSLETILYNEVGMSDPYYHERRDVAKIVINRHNIPLFSQLDLRDSLFYYLPNKLVSNLEDYTWLNVLFKEGEFSFTYFYIPGNLRIYCPDMSRRGRNLRKKNVRISLNMLLDRNYSFDALRYFSRESMTGRINMASVWKNYRAVEERPADLIPHKSKVVKLYNKGSFKYLYHFYNAEKKLFEVVKMGNKNYVLTRDKSRVYGHRSPHKFTYFILKE